MAIMRWHAPVVAVAVAEDERKIELGGRKSVQAGNAPSTRRGGELTMCCC